MTEIKLYDSDKYPFTEFACAKNISVTTNENGDMSIRIYIRSEVEDDRAMTYIASHDEARAIAAALIGTHSGFLDLADRATRGMK